MTITLSQLRTLVAICDNDLNVTAAAQQLRTSQPAVSKQLSTLEQALGAPLFYRNGKRFQYETVHCREILPLAREVLLKCDNLLALSQPQDDLSGTLQIGTTHTQARYVLPRVLAAFRREYPKVAVEIRQGAPAELVRQLSSNQLDFVLCTEALETNANFRTMVSFSWNRCLLLPPAHPLTKTRTLSLKALAKHPMVTYTPGFTGRSAFDAVFAAAGLTPQVSVAATDADVIKTYVRLNFGIGIVAEMAYDEEKDKDLLMRPLGHLFPAMQVRLAYQREKFLTAGMQRFIEIFRQEVG